MKTFRAKIPAATHRTKKEVSKVPTRTTPAVAATTPLRVDQALVNLARNAGAIADRPATAQIEHWAKMGRVLDSVLSGNSAAKVKKLSRVENLDEIITFSQSKEGREKVRKAVLKHGAPTYEADPRSPGRVLQRSPDGTVRSGRFVNRQFVPTNRSRQ